MNPIRTCIGCRARDDQARLLRLVRRGDLVVDATRPRLEGRGAYLHRGCITLAVQRQAIRRAFGPGASLAPSLAAPGVVPHCQVPAKVGPCLT